MEFKDYYQTLGVKQDASDDDIKRAYRKLARKYHPDVSKESDAEARMRDVNEAYDVLRDAEKRQAYDKLASGAAPDGSFQPPPDRKSTRLNSSHQSASRMPYSTCKK